ncbi:MAG: hypothetical protein ACLU6Y_03795 [Ruminococcus sp.]
MKRNQKEGVSLKETEKSNYDQVIENWRLKFLANGSGETDPEVSSGGGRRGAVYRIFFQKLRIDRKSGVITRSGSASGL